MRVIYYYQTFCGLKNLKGVTHIHLASIHFGYEEPNSTPYIHLNDVDALDPSLDKVWNECREAKEEGISIRLMIGGAGGGFTALFSNYKIFYPLLQDLLYRKSWIDGIDLDIEEIVCPDSVIKLVKDLDRDFPHLALTFAPLASSLVGNGKGMGGFVYKDLLAKLEKPVEYFNVQAYGSLDSLVPLFKSIVKNGYSPSSIVLGTLSPLSSFDMDELVRQLVCIHKTFEDFGGTFIWEYCNAPPDWAEIVSKSFK